MSYEIQIEPDAWEHLNGLSAYHPGIVVSAVEVQLRDTPMEETRHRKPLGPNPLAAWELRVGDFRVSYDVIESDAVVTIHAIGIKIHNRLTIASEKYEP